MNQAYRDEYGKYFGHRRLNLGCALNPEPGWINLDQNAAVLPDVVWDLEKSPLPFERNSFDCVLGSHVFEHVTNLVPLVEDLYRIISPGGYLIAVTPYGSSDSAWDSPHHVRSFNENTWHYFGQQIYSAGTAGHGATEGYAGNFQVVSVMLVPYPEFRDDPELEFKKKHWRNVIQEIHAVLRKVE